MEGEARASAAAAAGVEGAKGLLPVARRSRERSYPRRKTSSLRRPAKGREEYDGAEIGRGGER